jgi:hypothetical protein
MQVATPAVLEGGAPAAAHSDADVGPLNATPGKRLRPPPPALPRLLPLLPSSTASVDDDAADAQHALTGEPPFVEGGGVSGGANATVAAISPIGTKM